MRTDYGRATHPQTLDDPLESQDVSRYPARDPERPQPGASRIDPARIFWALVVALAIGGITLAMVMVI